MRLIGLIVAVVLLASSPAPAQTPEAQPPEVAGAEVSGTKLDPTMRRVRQLSDELKSPFCPGKTLMTCTSYKAFELRREIEDMVRSGMTDAQIISQLETRHGNDISNPKQPWYTFFVPFLPFIVLAGLIFWIVRRWQSRDEAVELGGADISPSMIADVSSDSADDADAEARLSRLRARVRDVQD